MTNLDDLVLKAKTLKKLGVLKKHMGYPELVLRTNYVDERASVSERLWHVQNNSYSIPMCPVCGNNTKWRWETKTYSIYCSSKCAHNDNKVLEKTKQTNLTRYGVDNPLKSIDVRQKGLDTIYERYGVNNAFWAKGREHNIQTLIHSKNKNIQHKQNIIELIDQRLTQSQIGEQLNICQPRVSNLLRILQLKTKVSPLTSKHQQEIYNFVQSILPDSEILLNDKTSISPYHIDILIPSHRIGIEYNGVYWHSESHKLDTQYHNRKTNMCNNIQIQLVQIYDNEWYNVPHIVKSRLSNILNVTPITYHARKLTVVELSTQQSNEFLISNHIQGDIPASVRYGLIDDEGEILCCCTFGKSRYDKQYQYELLRYCNKINTTVVGGAGRLLKTFIRNYNPQTIVSYADRRWSIGKLYNTLGFEFNGNTPPNYHYFHSNNTTKLLSRQSFQKHKLKDKLHFFDPSLTEWQNMQLNGYDRIWDCGHSKWVLRTG